MSTIIGSTSTLADTVSLPSLQQQQQPRKEHWRGDLPPPPNNLSFCPPNQDKYSNSLNIVNRHGNLLSLLDAVYPPTICHICDTELASPSENDLHYQAKHYSPHISKKFKPKQRYLCLSPHCDQTFRSRGLLRFHISTCHLVDNEQVPKTDPLYMLYAPPSLVPSPPELAVYISTSLSPNNSTAAATTNGSAPMMVPQKRKYERKQKTWNPVGKSSLPGQTNFTLSTSLPSFSMNLAQPQPKRRGRPPKIKPVIPAPPLTNTINSQNANTNDHVKTNQPSASSMISFSSDPTGKTNESDKTATKLPPHNQKQQSKVFRLVQQVIPQRGGVATSVIPPSSSSSSSSTSTPTPAFSSTLRPKNISRSNLSQTSQRLLAEKYNPLECPACHMIFQRKKNVANHLATEHNGEECFQCVYPDCYHPKRFSTREGLVYHLLHSHDTVGGGGFKNKGTGSDTSASELALMDSSDTASMDDDSYSTSTTTMVQPMKNSDVDAGDDIRNKDDDNNSTHSKNSTMGIMDKNDHSTTRKTNGTATNTTPTKTSSHRGRKKRS